MARQRQTQALITGLGLGAGAMYFLDVNRGRRRRAIFRDKVYSLWNRSGDAIDTTTRNVRDRFSGAAASMRSVIEGEDYVSDDVLTERVRSRLGRVVSHPSSIMAMARDGRVILSGPILQKEVKRLLSAVRVVRGVKDVENRLDVHHDRDIPALQGGKTPGAEWEILQTNWSPSFRLFMSCVGGAMTAYGIARRDPVGAVTATGGGLLLARALTNMELRRLFGVGAGRRAMSFHKTININAPVEEVFAFWEQWENFPKFMSHIEEVRITGEGRTHWRARGPAGVSVEWDAVVTRREPNRLIAWKTEPGGAVQNSGMVRFETNAAGGTQLDIMMSYNPPAGALGHLVAAVFGADPKQAMDEDLVRLKSLIEDRKTTVGGRTVTREEISPHA